MNNVRKLLETVSKELFCRRIQDSQEDNWKHLMTEMRKHRHGIKKPDIWYHGGGLFQQRPSNIDAQ